MAWYRCGSGSGVPSSLKTEMDAVLNKKWGTSTTYPPEDWPETVNLMGPLPERTVSGSIVAFADGADDVPLKSCEVTIAPTLDGVSSVDVVQTGKNLIKPDKYQASSNIITIGQNDGTSFDTFLKAGTYTISYTTTGDSCYIYRREENDVSNTNMGKRLSVTFTIESEGNFRFWLYGDGAVSANISNVQLEIGSIATDYESFVTPTTPTASLGRTIYGGEVDVVNGTGTETNGLQTFDGTEVWTLSGTTFWYTSKPKENVKASHICTTSNNVVIRYSTNGQIRCYISDNQGVVDTNTNMNTLLSNGVSFNYQLNYNVDFTFTPVPILSRLGDNTMWGDGDLSVTYRRDIALALAQ